MRKTRLVILPTKCLNQVGFLLLFLSCPVIGDWGRIKPDTEMSQWSIQIEREGTCGLVKDPPERPLVVADEKLESNATLTDNTEMNDLEHVSERRVSGEESARRRTRSLEARREDRSRRSLSRASERRVSENRRGLSVRRGRRNGEREAVRRVDNREDRRLAARRVTEDRRLELAERSARRVDERRARNSRREREDIRSAERMDYRESRRARSVDETRMKERRVEMQRKTGRDDQRARRENDRRVAERRLDARRRMETITYRKSDDVPEWSMKSLFKQQGEQNWISSYGDLTTTCLLGAAVFYLTTRHVKTV